MRRVLITGGTGNIGTRLVKDMLNDGHYVYFTARSHESADKLLRTVEFNKFNCKPIIFDFLEKEALNSLLNQINDYPDFIIHNARSLDNFKMDESGAMSIESFQQEFFNGVTFPYLLTMKLLNKNKNIKDVLFISSMYGIVAPSPSLYDDFEKQSPINYGVVKSAQIHLVKELAVRLSKKKVRVNAVSYGGVEGRADEAFKRRYSKLTPTGRMLNHDDLYPPVKYFIDNPNLNVTGENLKVDGGWTIW